MWLRFLITYYGPRHHTPRKLPPPVELFFTFVRHFSNQSSRSSSDIRRTERYTQSSHPCKALRPVNVTHLFSASFSLLRTSIFTPLIVQIHPSVQLSACGTDFEPVSGRRCVQNTRHYPESNRRPRGYNLNALPPELSPSLRFNIIKSNR